MTAPTDHWYIVAHADGRMSKCGNWFQAFNELAMPGAVGYIKHDGVIVVRRYPGGKWQWFLKSSHEPGLDVGVEEQ